MPYNKDEVTQAIEGHKANYYADDFTRLAVPRVFAYLFDQLSYEQKNSILTAFNNCVDNEAKVESFDQLSNELQQALSFQPYDTNNDFDWVEIISGLDPEFGSHGSKSLLLKNLIQYYGDFEKFKNDMPNTVTDEQAKQLQSLHQLATLATKVGRNEPIKNADYTGLFESNWLPVWNATKQQLADKKEAIKDQNIGDQAEALANFDMQAIQNKFPNLLRNASSIHHSNRSPGRGETLRISANTSNQQQQQDQQQQSETNQQWLETLKSNLSQQDEDPSTFVNDSQVNHQSDNNYEIKRTIHPRQGQNFEPFTQSFQLNSQQGSLQGTLQLKSSDSAAVKQQKRQRMAEEAVEACVQYYQAKGEDLTSLHITMPQEWVNDSKVMSAVQSKANEHDIQADDLKVDARQPQQQPAQPQPPKPPGMGGL